MNRYSKRISKLEEQLRARKPSKPPDIDIAIVHTKTIVLANGEPQAL
jgi:hypothetical protein